MPSIQRQLVDIGTGGGVIVTSPNTTVFANGIPVAVAGGVVSPHHNCSKRQRHCAAIISGLGGASARVFAQGIPVSVTGDSDTCGHSRALGSNNVFVG